MSDQGAAKASLTAEQLEQIEQNRQRALAKLAAKKREREQDGAQQPAGAAAVSAEKRQRTAETQSTSDGTATAAAAELVCEVCAMKDSDAPGGAIDPKLHKAFAVAVCRQCKEKHDDYNLISKTDIQNDFMLPEGTIRVLKYIEIENPRNARWTPMRLYLQKEVLKWSIDRWGGQDGIEAERKRRQAKKWDASVTKTKGIFKDGGSSGGGARKGKGKANRS